MTSIFHSLNVELAARHPVAYRRTALARVLLAHPEGFLRAVRSFVFTKISPSPTDKPKPNSNGLLRAFLFPDGSTPSTSATGSHAEEESRTGAVQQSPGHIQRADAAALLPSVLGDVTTSVGPRVSTHFPLMWRRCPR